MPATTPPTLSHFAVDAALRVLPRKAFAFAGKRWLGIQGRSWERDEAIWDFRLGKYRGSEKRPFLLALPQNLRALGASLETQGIDPLARQSAGTINVACETVNQNTRLVSIEFSLYQASDGALIETISTPYRTGTTTAQFTPVPNGSYQVWARCFDSIFGNTEASAGGFAALRVQIGPGAWQAGAYPGAVCPLYAKSATAPEVNLNESNRRDYQLAFDSLAMSVSASSGEPLKYPVRNANGTFDVPAGSFLIAGMRASISGPQTAFWLLHADGTARLLAVSENLTNGKCECGKSDHHASGIWQDTDGTVWVLSECSLHRYDPDAARVGLALPGVPAQTGGEPGGQCLRRYEGALSYSTELLVEAPLTPGFGPYFYDYFVRRIGSKLETGPGSQWHGPNNSELYNSVLYSTRSSAADLDADDTLTILDFLQNNRWSQGGGISGGIQRPAKTHRFRQLRRRGNQLFVFGYKPGALLDIYSENAAFDDVPQNFIIDEGKFWPINFPYFVRRVTRSIDEAGRENLLCVVSGASEGNGGASGSVALRVIELPQSENGNSRGGVKICSFWNDDLQEYRMSAAAFAAAGGDKTKLPPFYAWQPRQGYNGGGVWQGATVAPSDEYYLQLDLSNAAIIRYIPHAPPVMVESFVDENDEQLTDENDDDLLGE